MGLKIGDIVARKSYGCDVFFKVTDIKNEGGENIVTLKGISYRVEADAPESDLELQSDGKVDEYKDRCLRIADKDSREAYSLRYRGYPKKAYNRDTSNEDTGKIRKPGKVLHIDGDKDYLDTCLNEYRKLGISVLGRFISEKDQAAGVSALLHEFRPDILVLTGHDGFLKRSDSFTNIANYRNSQHFIDAVKEARKFSNDLDSLVIFAGACQSFFKKT